MNAPESECYELSKLMGCLEVAEQLSFDLYLYMYTLDLGGNKYEAL